jgi:ferric-dicitrate binding protein FerR (iron transport regulator)
MHKELIRKHLNGACSFEEEQQALKILSTDEGLEVLNELADEFWEGDLSKEKIDDKRLFQNILSKLPTTRISYWKYIGYAASLLLLVVSAYLISNNTSSIDQSSVVVPVEMVHKSTTKGQKSTIILSDGSKVVLNSLSAISYPKYFTDSTRNIELEGEAFFEVFKDKNRPFTVSTGGTKTQALGTSFNINSRSSLHKISLVTGKVLVNTDDDDAFILAPGEALEVDTNNGLAIKGSFDIEKEISWKDGKLYFNDAQPQEVIGTLELWYDVKFNFVNKQMTNKRYTGQFENASLSHVLKSMSFALDFDYALEEKNVTIIIN